MLNIFLTYFKGVLIYLFRRVSLTRGLLCLEAFGFKKIEIPCAPMLSHFIYFSKRLKSHVHQCSAISFIFYLLFFAFLPLLNVLKQRFVAKGTAYHVLFGVCVLVLLLYFYMAL